MQIIITMTSKMTGYKLKTAEMRKEPMHGVQNYTDDKTI
jgi:hypothetical protein